MDKTEENTMGWCFRHTNENNDKIKEYNPPLRKAGPCNCRFNNLWNTGLNTNWIYIYLYKYNRNIECILFSGRSMELRFTEGILMILKVKLRDSPWTKRK